MTGAIYFASAADTHPDPAEAAQSLIPHLTSQLAGHPPHLVLAFISGHGPGAAEELAQDLRRALNPTLFAGCTAEGVIGAEHEIEHKAAAAVVAAHLPGVEFAPFALRPADWRQVLNDPARFQRAISAPPTTRFFILLADPFSSPMDELLEAFNTQYAGVPITGGMASSGHQPESNRLFLNDQVQNAGAVGAALSGPLDVDVIVSQGCRPVGRPLTITTAQENVIYQLEGEPPLAQLQTLFDAMPPADLELLHNGLFIGRAIVPEQDELGRGDFLIRGVVGMDQRSGAIAVGDYVREGEVVQFHLRDAATAQEDLELMLLPQTFSQPPAGAFLFSCNGRGTRLYDHPDGDITTFRQALGPTPLAGFFCAGEIGPIGGRNFLHGHTASMVLFRPPHTEPEA
jgi:small ligand-binding sensory domain FIST